MKYRSKLIHLIAGLLVFASCSGFAVVAKQNELDKYTNLSIPGIAKEAEPDAVRVSFYGVSSLLFDDGKNKVLIDGFFTRPSRTAVILGHVTPSPEIIRAGLKRAGIDKLDGVLVTHSHYDHALDCAEIARQTGALVVGSNSTANIARGNGLKEENIRVVKDSDSVDFGQFHCTFVRSAHVPAAVQMIAGGQIDKVLHTPARAYHYQEGGTYSILISHGEQSYLVQSSAGFIEGALRGQHADVVFLGVGLLGRQTDAYRDKFWKEVPEMVGAKRVIPVHFDDFMRPGNEPLVIAPRPFDEVEKAIQFCMRKAKQDKMDFRFIPTWTPVDSWNPPEVPGAV